MRCAFDCLFYSQTIILFCSILFCFKQRFTQKLKRFHAYLFRSSSQFHMHTSHCYSSQPAHTSSVAFLRPDCVFSTSPNIRFALLMGKLLLCALYTFNKYANVWLKIYTKINVYIKSFHSNHKNHFYTICVLPMRVIFFQVIKTFR